MVVEAEFGPAGIAGAVAGVADAAVGFAADGCWVEECPTWVRRGSTSKGLKTLANLLLQWYKQKQIEIQQMTCNF